MFHTTAVFARPRAALSAGRSNVVKWVCRIVGPSSSPASSLIQPALVRSSPRGATATGTSLLSKSRIHGRSRALCVNASVVSPPRSRTARAAARIIGMNDPG